MAMQAWHNVVCMNVVCVSVYMYVYGMYVCMYVYSTYVCMYVWYIMCVCSVSNNGWWIWISKVLFWLSCGDTKLIMALTALDQLMVDANYFSAMLLALLCIILCHSASPKE